MNTALETKRERLKLFVNQEQMLIELLNISTEEQLDYLANHFNIQWSKTPAELLTATQPAEIRMLVHIGDTIKLEGRSKREDEFLASYGYWWKIAKAHHPPAGAIGAVTTGRPPSWFLQSVPANKQGGHGKKVPENLWLLKDNDPLFRIVEVCVSPKEFNYRDYK